MKHGCFVIVAETPGLGSSLRRYLKYVMSIEDDRVYYSPFEKIIACPHRLFEFDVILIEGVSLKSENDLSTEGYRTGKELLLAGKKVLILFSLPDELIPTEGPFWINILSSEKTLKQKIIEILHAEFLGEKVLKEYFRKLENKLTLLKEVPTSHGHGH